MRCVQYTCGAVLADFPSKLRRRYLLEEAARQRQIRWNAARFILAIAIDDCN
jgi:hypothetical protein